MSAEYVQEIGLESELLLLHFPTLRIRQLTLFGCESWGFVIYNQFSALVSSALACPFFLFLLPFVSCPEGPHSIPLSVLSVQSPSFYVCLLSSLHALQRPVKCAPAVQAVGAIYHGTSSGSPGSTAPTPLPSSNNFRTSVSRT